MLYVAIVSITVLAFSVFLSILLQARVKNQTIAEVEQQGDQIAHIITQSIRNAETINSPAVGTGASSLSLDVVTAANDPTVFDLSGGVIRIQEGVGSPISLNNARVIASGLTFYNLSRASTPGILRVQFTLTHVNPSGRNEYNYSRTFTAGGALRQP